MNGTTGASRALFAVAASAFASGIGLGAAARRGSGDTLPRPLHHVAYFTAAASVGALALDGLGHRRVSAVGTIPAALLLGVLPSTRGGTRSHVVIALASASLFTVGWAAQRLE